MMERQSILCASLRNNCTTLIYRSRLCYSRLATRRARRCWSSLSFFTSSSLWKRSYFVTLENTSALRSARLTNTLLQLEWSFRALGERFSASATPNRSNCFVLACRVEWSATPRTTRNGTTRVPRRAALYYCWFWGHKGSCLSRLGNLWISRWSVSLQ